VFGKKSYLSSWVFTAMQSVHIRMNSSLSHPPLKKILDPPMSYDNQGKSFILAGFIFFPPSPDPCESEHLTH